MSQYIRIQEASKDINLTVQTLKYRNTAGKLKLRRHPMNNCRPHNKVELVIILTISERQ